MVQLGNLKFSTSLGVMYTLKQKYNHNNLKETYALLNEVSNGDIDTYMATNQNKPDASELWLYFNNVIDGITDSV